MMEPSRMERSFDIHEVAEALAYLNESDRETWVRMAMAIKSEFGDAGFGAWDDWSQGYAKYKAGDATSVWKSCKGAGSVTLGTLIHEAMQAGWKPRQLDADERARLDREAAERRKQVEAQQRIEAERAASLQAIVARTAQEIWESPELGTVGKSQYLGRKKVGAHGVRFFKRGLIVVTDEERTTVNLVRGSEAIQAFFKRPDLEQVSFKHLKHGAFALPMVGSDGMVVNLQVIFPSGKKSFLKGGRKQGCWHLIGGPVQEVLAFAEGYATGASIHEATGYPVAVAFDAGNLLAAGRGLRALYPEAQFIWAADDDRETNGNPGVTKAQEAAAELGGIVVWPEFGEAA